MMHARIQQLRSNLARCVQNRRTITAYYSELQEIQDELYAYTPLPCCSCGSIMAKQRDDEKTHQLLMGLDDAFSALRSNLLASSHPLPPPTRVYELLLQEEQNQTTCRRHLPEDLVPEILSRLPVKSVLRFRCVSQSWLSSVDEDRDYFARLHLNTFKNNRHETRILSVSVDLTVHHSHTFEPIHNTPPPIEFGLSNSFFVSSLDGLILLNSYCVQIDAWALKLWNPSLRKYRNILQIPLLDILEETLLGLGYNPWNGDYNIVKLIFLKSEEKVPKLLKVAIYSVRAGSWKFIPFKGRGTSCSNWRWKYRSITTVYLQGRLYLCVRDADNHTVQELLSFDLSNKEFSLVEMPNDPDPAGDQKLFLIDGGSSMALFGCRYANKTAWVLEGKSMEWTKRCLHTLENAELLYGKKNGDKILVAKKTIGSDEVMLYNPEEQEYKRILPLETTSNPPFCKYVSAYIESLILP